jgi:hypothetical protein
MSLPLAARLRGAVDAARASLDAISEEQSSRPARPGRWPPKEELGHLIDSASNNHIRIVRAALNGEFRGPGYEQNRWVALHGYAEMPWTELIDFWLRYNALLAHLIERLPPESLTAACAIGEDGPMPLAQLIEDYVHHMRHHLDQIHGTVGRG